MSFLDILLRDLGLRSGGTRYANSAQRIYFSEEQQHILTELAQLQNRSEYDVLNDIMFSALATLETGQRAYQSWQSLTSREKQVARLICEGYTNPQIAANLTIASDTAKVHVRNILTKFGLRTKEELRATLTEWNLIEDVSNGL